VPWTKTSDPQQLVEDMGRVGLDVALTAMAAVPIYGTIASALVSGGRLLYRLMAAREEKVLALPWAEYSKDTDEEIYANLRRCVSRLRLDGSSCRPSRMPRGRSARRRTRASSSARCATGDKELAWSVNYGCMPGTLRVAGQTQSIVTQPGDVASHLVRNLRHPKGVTPKTVPIDWRSTVIACGDYFPSLAQVGAVTWQQCMRAGSPGDVLPRRRGHRHRVEELLG
jgi:hypothetical protein